MKVELSDKEVEFLIRALCSNYAERESDFDEDITSGGITADLIGKLVSAAGDKGRAYYFAAKRDRCSNVPINKKLFMGAGWRSSVDAATLHKRLRFAMLQLSALEQNGGMGCPFDSLLHYDCIQDIKKVVKDILIAFGLQPDDLK